MVGAGRNPPEPSDLRIDPRMGCIERVRVLISTENTYKESSFVRSPIHLHTQIHLEQRKRSSFQAKAATSVDDPIGSVGTNRLHPP